LTNTTQDFRQFAVFRIVTDAAQAGKVAKKVKSQKVKGKSEEG